MFNNNCKLILPRRVECLDSQVERKIKLKLMRLYRKHLKMQVCLNFAGIPTPAFQMFVPETILKEQELCATRNAKIKKSNTSEILRDLSNSKEISLEFVRKLVMMWMENHFQDVKSEISEFSLTPLTKNKKKNYSIMISTSENSIVLKFLKESPTIMIM